MKNQLLLKMVGLILILNTSLAYAQLGKCKGKYFGNIVANSVQSNYTSLWNQMTMENASKWQSTNGTKGVYNFGGSDIGFNWAKNNNGLFKYHCLMWGGQTAGWIANASSADIQAEIPKYFKAVADHYNPMGGLKLIDVLNEPVNTPIASNLKNALIAGYKAEPANAGDINNQYGWAIWCFQLARKYFPNATLLINEYNIEMNWNNCRAPYIAMASAIKNAPNLTDGKKNLIDGVGLQCHGIDNLTAANFKACLDEIWTKAGLPCHITEFDQPAKPDEAKQKSVYSTLIPVAWEHPHVAGITLWGFIEGQTWITGSGLINNGQDRPAMTWLKSYMAGRPSLSCCPAPAPFAACNGSNPPTVSITSPADNANFSSGTTIDIAATATDADGTVSSVKFYDGTTLLSTDNSSPYTYSWTNAAVGAHTIKAVATDNSGGTTEVAITIKVNEPRGPYGGTAHAIPGIIQSEEYDLGGNGIAYMDDSPGSSVTPTVNYRPTEDVDIESCTDAGGGYNIGFATSGEWLEYTVNVTAAGNYDLDMRLAESGDGKTMHISMDGTNISGAVAVPNTGGWQTWTTLTKTNIPLTQGKHIMRITFDSDYINLNYVEFKTAFTTGLEEEEMADLMLFPNPFTSEGLQVHKSGDFNYRITNVSGSIIESGKASGVVSVGKSLSPGVYFLSIERNNVTSLHKIVKQ